MALEKCLAVLEMLSRTTNRLLLDAEIKQASIRPESFWEQPEQNEPCDVPFPFIATCFAIASAFNVAEGYFHRLHVLPWYLRFDEGDNNDGEPRVSFDFF